VDVYVYKLTVAQLRSIPPRFLGFLLASSHCCNELAAFLPFVLFEQDITQATEVESAFIRSRAFTVDRVLTSKIVEYGKLCSKFLNKQSDVKSDPLLVKIAKDYEPISNEINPAKWAAILRNTVSFHYDQQHVLKTLEKLKDDEAMQFIASDLKGMTLFDFADYPISYHLLELAGHGDTDKGIVVINQFIKKLIFSIMEFHASTTKAIFLQNGIMLDCEIKEIRSHYCARIGDIYIPLSVDVTESKELEEPKSD
jgi:hypothetical protein